MPPPIPACKRRPAWQPRGDGGPPVSQVPHAIPELLVLLGGPVEEAVPGEGVEDVAVALGALVVLAAGDEVGNLVPGGAEAGVGVEEDAVLVLCPAALAEGGVEGV